jgi:histidinol-phosphate aminotransferase
MDYQRVPDPGDGLRLHLNENTAGCSPLVLDAIRAIEATRIAVYPDYTDATRECAEAIGVPPDWVALVNGLDEGIWAAAGACIRAGDREVEAIVPEPAFDMYAACVDAAGGRVVAIPPGPELAFPTGAVLAAVRPLTRLVFLCSPNNPTGVAIPAETVSRISRALPAGALLFLDEAYVDFGAESFVARLDAHANVVVGRTFAKAHGLAALRAGCVIAQPAAIRFLQRVIPPYSLNICAVEGMRAALRDTRHRAWYCRQVAESRELLYDACARHGLRYWPSEANFVLVRVGEGARRLVDGLAARGIHIRDRTTEPGCAGCVRITTGVVEHTRRCIAAMEELL